MDGVCLKDQVTDLIEFFKRVETGRIEDNEERKRRDAYFEARLNDSREKDDGVLELLEWVRQQKGARKREATDSLQNLSEGMEVENNNSSRPRMASEQQESSLMRLANQQEVAEATRLSTQDE